MIPSRIIYQAFISDQDLRRSRKDVPLWRFLLLCRCCSLGLVRGEKGCLGIAIAACVVMVEMRMRESYVLKTRVSGGFMMMERTYCLSCSKSHFSQRKWLSKIKPLHINKQRIDNGSMGERGTGRVLQSGVRVRGISGGTYTTLIVTIHARRSREAAAAAPFWADARPRNCSTSPDRLALKLQERDACLSPKLVFSCGRLILVCA